MKIETIEDIAKGGLFVDGDWVETKDQDADGQIRLIQLADVGVGAFRDRSNRWMRRDQALKLSCTMLHEGDILVARMPDPIARACLVPNLSYPSVTVVDVAILRPSREDIDKKYLMWMMNSPAFAAKAEALAAGTTRKRISRKNLARLDLPIPAIGKQRQIVDILEDHLSRLEAAERQLKRAQRQTLLLTRAFLDRTLAERSSAPDWHAVPLELLTDGSRRAIVDGPFGSNLASAHYTDVGPLVVRLQNIGDGVFKRSDAHISPERFERLRAHEAAAGDVVVASLGEAIPRAAIVPAGLGPTIVKADCVRVRARSATMAAWIVASTRSSSLKQWAAGRMHGVGRQRLGVAGIRALPILVPDSELEIEPILRQISSLDEEAGRLNVSVSDQLRRSDALRRALLTAAFTGNLTGRASDTDRLEEAAYASHDSC